MVNSYKIVTRRGTIIQAHQTAEAAQAKLFAKRRPNRSSNKNLPVRGGLISIVFREQNRCGTSVGFCDDPEFDSLCGEIGREKAKALFQGQFILLAVFLRQVAPITGLMPLDGCQNVILGKLSTLGRKYGDVFYS